MALTVYNTAATASSSFSVAAVAGCQLTTLSLRAAPAGSETGYDPANGVATLFGVHDGEIVTGTVSGRLLANGVALATIGANVTATLTAAMCVLAGYTGNNGTVVCTGLQTSAAPGAFKTISMDFTHLRGIA